MNGYCLGLPENVEVSGTPLWILAMAISIRSSMKIEECDARWIALKTVGTKGSCEALLRLAYHYFGWGSVEITSVRYLQKALWQDTTERSKGINNG